MLHNRDCVAIFEILVSVFLQAGVSTVFRWPDRTIWVSKPEKVPNLKDRESVTNTVENVSQGHANVKSPKKNLWPVMPLAHSGSQHVWLERCQGQWPPWEMPLVEINKHGLNTTTQQVLSGASKAGCFGWKQLWKREQARESKKRKDHLQLWLHIRFSQGSFLKTIYSQTSLPRILNELIWSGAQVWLCF